MKFIELPNKVKQPLLCPETNFWSQQSQFTPILHRQNLEGKRENLEISSLSDG